LRSGIPAARLASVNSRDSIDGSAWVVLLEHSYSPESDEAYLPDCVSVPRELLEATPEQYRQRAEQMLNRLGVPLEILNAGEIPDDGCVTIWVPRDIRSSGDFELPFLGRSTVACFHGDSNGDRVLMSFALGRWYSLHSWNVWT